MTYLELLAMLEELIETNKVNQFDEINLETLKAEIEAYKQKQ